ncbi:ATP adenylyltransferase C-terminal [Penicillium hispanicum]|uniref:ATP adenylyltransferase C-terminal n=1 Tax=Penicillium hispanicum TaxID=1080232 RepID=UPI002540BAF4|nr:ATP adenylyltransferase C-terminal [Penicillium hispanicum]KAJ5591849.1 ATP adenylyltransferase C-terminal [Penicillium hispanicum]
MQLGLSEHLSALVARRFATAKEAGHLVFSPTHLSIIIAAGIPFQLRYCPALAKKPSNLKPESGPKPPKPDPFQDPSPDLLLTQFPPERPTHALVLNKFPVIPNHFILATKEWKPQTDLLEKVDLEATYECLQAWNEPEPKKDPQSSDEDPPIPSKRLFAFFNSGDESGASQPHRHLQFLPVEAMRQPESQGWHPLIEILAAQPHPQAQAQFLTLPHLPFAHFALPIPPNPTPEALHEIYLSLYRVAIAATEGDNPRSLSTSTSASKPVRAEGPAAISYNLALTLSTMMICPRRQETARVPVDAVAAPEIADHGVVSLNGTILAGTLMVKAEAEWDALRGNPEILTRILADVGFARGEVKTAVL